MSAALHRYQADMDEAIARLLDHLSPEAEAERQRRFARNMAELAAIRADLSAILTQEPK